MKKFALAALLIAPVSVSFAASNSVGCGLGSQLFDGQSGIFSQSLAVITNGSFGNQTFGISSGTLGCAQDGTVEASVRVPMFVGSNLDALARDMAQGQGESLDSLAALMGIGSADKSTFFNVTKSNHARIFAAANTTSGDVLDSLYRIMAQDVALARYVPA